MESISVHIDKKELRSYYSKRLYGSYVIMVSYILFMFYLRYIYHPSSFEFQYLTQIFSGIYNFFFWPPILFYIFLFGIIYEICDSIWRFKNEVETSEIVLKDGLIVKTSKIKRENMMQKIGDIKTLYIKVGNSKYTIYTAYPAVWNQMHRYCGKNDPYGEFQRPITMNYVINYEDVLNYFKNINPKIKIKYI